MSKLFSPMKIGSLEIANRIVHSATYECMAGPNGEATDQLLKRYTNLAKGEVGLIIPGYMFTQQPGKALVNQTGIHSDEMIPGLKRLTRAIHEHGGKVVFQVAHAGRQTTKKVTGGKPVGASSSGRDPVNFVKPRAMTEDEIQESIIAFGDAAGRAVEAGADGVQIHAAHGYLVNQFLSPFFNRRTDSWGGSEENRFRFLQEILLTMKETVPAGFPILIKLNTHDHTPVDGITHALAKNYAKRLVDLGIDAVEISSGTALYSFMNTCRGQVPVKELTKELPLLKRPIGRIVLGRLAGKYDLEEGYHVEAAKIVKPVLNGVPLILVGGMRSKRLMEETLDQRYADFISMSRPFVREPYLVKSMRKGSSDKASCVSCNKCFAAIASASPLKCSHKPG
jgi:2,4-dienoyl-CoA reductase-like NADH-dependent reductase (Old Yellow Enzyme family)